MHFHGLGRSQCVEHERMQTSQQITIQQRDTSVAKQERSGWMNKDKELKRERKSEL